MSERWGLRLASATTLALGLLWSAACGPSVRYASDEVGKLHVENGAATPAKLAAEQLGAHDVPLALVDDYDSVLRSLERKCRERPTVLADVAVRHARAVSAGGRAVTPLDVLRAIDEHAPDGDPDHTDCTAPDLTLHAASR
jgi:hypothetical protein